MKTTYVTHMGDDDFICDVARVSFDKKASDYSKERNERLISYLAKHNHWTPFGHPQITMIEEVPIFISRQRFKHTVGFVYNEVSRRYVSDTPEMYEFDELRDAPTDNIKQGSGGKHDESDLWIRMFNESNTQCKRLYKLAIKRGVCPEQARSVLPQSMMTKYVVTGSLSAWARAYKLRIDSHSQKEIQLLAEEWDKIIAPLFPVAWKELIK